MGPRRTRAAGRSLGRLHRLPEPAPENRPDPSQPDTHSFVLRIWIEEKCDTSGAVRWRGSITHVPSARTRYFEDLADMCAFVAAHMEATASEGQR